MPWPQTFGGCFHPKHDIWIYMTLAEDAPGAGLRLSRDNWKTWRAFDELPFSNILRVEFDTANDGVIHVTAFGGSVWREPAMHPSLSAETVKSSVLGVIPCYPAADVIPRYPAADVIPHYPAADVIPHYPATYVIPHYPAIYVIPRYPAARCTQPFSSSIWEALSCPGGREVCAKRP